MNENYRSKRNIVDFADQFVRGIRDRLKHNPGISVHGDNGKIKLVRYRSNNLITPVVKDLLSAELAGTTGVLTKTNEEALQLTGLLLQNGMPAKLIQSNEGFNLYNLLEVRFFFDELKLTEDTYMISDEMWVEAKRALAQRFTGSSNLELCVNMIKDFEAVNPQNKYKSDLEQFVQESKLEDFYGENSETILVSTIHKAKGREFDNVFLMLDQFNPAADEAKRQLYVALTRAKRNLTIHYNGSYLEFISTEDFQKVTDDEAYLPPRQLALQLTYKDVWLDFFLSRQDTISLLNSGDVLTLTEDGCCNSKGVLVLRFSKQFINQIEALKLKNYSPKTARVRFIVYWQREGSKQEALIVLPELYFARAGS